MRVDATILEDAKIITLEEHYDDRGFFYETYSSLKHDFIEMKNPQDNVSFTRERGAFRGMHWQVKPFDQGKLVTVLNGVVYDLIIDLRLDSITFGSCAGFILTGNKQLWVPPGFGHGFQTLTDNVTFHYKCTNLYSKGHERSININDPIFKNRLPLDITNISQKDFEAPYFKEICENLDKHVKGIKS